MVDNIFIYDVTDEDIQYDSNTDMSFYLKQSLFDHGNKLIHEHYTNGLSLDNIKIKIIFKYDNNEYFCTGIIERCDPIGESEFKVVRHSFDGKPSVYAYIWWGDDVILESHEFIGRLHREDGLPSSITYDKNMDKIFETWSTHGKLHRIDGPAVIDHENNKAEWWLFGYSMTFERWFMLTNNNNQQYIELKLKYGGK